MELTEDEKHKRKADLRESGMLKLQGKDYLPVAHRIASVRIDHPDWTIETGFETVGEHLVARAAVADGTRRTLATATKMVKFDGRGPAAKYPLEVAETGAIGRALGLCGYGTLAGEFEEGDQISDAPVETKRKW